LILRLEIEGLMGWGMMLVISISLKPQSFLSYVFFVIIHQAVHE
jgi:hypothetical protein